ncbi:MAG: hypothetical protein DDT36_01156 [Firmicutes bacterium]|nr:hypothetical protein [Bacillota bacterium]
MPGISSVTGLGAGGVTSAVVALSPVGAFVNRLARPALFAAANSAATTASRLPLARSPAYLIAPATTGAPEARESMSTIRP